MMIDMLFVLTLVAVLGCGLVAGIFFAFSTFVMKALARIPAAQGIAAMQAINITVINPWFMAVFMGTAVVCALIVAYALLQWSEVGAGYLLGGGLAYVIGTFLVTMVFNVPRNNALAAVDPAHDSSARLWSDYVASWTGWNHVRTAAALLAETLLIMAL